MRQQQMILPIGQDQKWFNSPVIFDKGTLTDIPQYIPDFDRREFIFAAKPDQRSRANPHLDMIVRKPFGKDAEFIPIGIVSKDYVLIKHSEVLQAVKQSLEQFKISAQEVRAEIRMAEHGERMALTLTLPDRYTFDPGDGHKIETRLECFNSVDGTTRFRAMMVWFRVVCSNGLVVGVTQIDVRRRHIGDLNLSDIFKVLSSGIGLAETEKENFLKWRHKTIPDGALVPWVEKDLKGQWGFKAATRAFHIACTGYDVEIAGQFKGQKPTTIKTKQTCRVPGSPVPSKNLFDISQVLAWLAKERRDVQEQLEWREQIPEILKPLMN
jgi:hypothetical protein